MKFRRLAAAGALLLVSTPLTAEAASPSPAPDLTVLRTALAGAPDATWEESPIRSDVLEGPFDAVTFVNVSWSDQPTRDDVRSRLGYDRFVGGYGRSFYSEPLDAWMVEDVKAFPNVADADSFWRWSMSEFHDDGDTANVVPAPSLPNSFGEKYRNGDAYGVDIYFPKSTYVFTVSTGSLAEYLVDVTQKQATAVYAYAPSSNLLPSTALPARSSVDQLRTLIAVIEILVAIVAMVCVGAMVTLLVLGSRRPPAQPASISPDGHYWWDGSSWQPMMRR